MGPDAVVVPLVLAAVAGGVDGTTTALRAVADGRRPLADVTVRYYEEVPRERTVEIEVAGDGHVRVTTRIPREECAGADGCWQTSARTLALEPAAHRALVAQLAEPGLAAVPREVAVMPGAARLQLVATVTGEGRLEVLASVAVAEREAAMRRLRATLLALAR